MTFWEDLSAIAKETTVTYLIAFAQKKATINKTKQKTPAKWGNIYINGMTNNGLTSRIYKQLIQLNIKNNKQLFLKRAEDLNRCVFVLFFPKRTYRWPTGT